MIAAQRQQEILRILRSRGGVSVSDLMERLNASAATVRRDLEELEAQNLLRRTRGGAVPLDPAAEDPAFGARAVEQVDEKRAIARTATRLVSPGQAVGLDAGTTMAVLAHSLRGVTPLTVVTNSLAVAGALGEVEGMTLVMTGGILQPSTQSLVGPLAEATLSGLMLDIAFMTARGLSPESGVMNTNLNSAGVKRGLVACARQIVVLADHTKFTRTGLVSVVPPERIHTLVTDWHTPEEVLAAFRERGVTVLVAQPGED